MPSFLHFYIEFFQNHLEFILCRKTGINKITSLGIPLFKTSIVEKLMLLVYNKRNDIVLQAFFKHNESADSAVAVLEGVYALEAYVKSDYIFESYSALFVITC